MIIIIHRGYSINERTDYNIQVLTLVRCFIIVINNMFYFNIVTSDAVLWIYSKLFWMKPFDFLY